MARLACFRRMCDADELPDRDAEPDDRDHQSSQADPVPDPHRQRFLSPDHREGKGNGCFVPLRHHFLCRTCSLCQGGALAVGHRNLPSGDPMLARSLGQPPGLYAGLPRGTQYRAEVQQRPPHSRKLNTTASTPKLAGLISNRPAPPVVWDKTPRSGHGGTTCDPRAIASSRPGSRTSSHGHSTVAGTKAREHLRWSEH